jgi:hypothetical protein
MRPVVALLLLAIGGSACSESGGSLPDGAADRGIHPVLDAGRPEGAISCPDGNIFPAPPQSILPEDKPCWGPEECKLLAQAPCPDDAAGGPVNAWACECSSASRWKCAITSQGGSTCVPPMPPKDAATDSSGPGDESHD